MRQIVTEHKSNLRGRDFHMNVIVATWAFDAIQAIKKYEKLGLVHGEILLSNFVISL